MWQRYKCVRQTDQSDCGAAALATMALHYKIPVGLERMRELTGTDRSGANMRGLQMAVDRLGFSSRAVKGSWESLPALPTPFVAHIRAQDGSGHFVVIHRVRRNSVLVADPAVGLRTLSREDFQACWTGYLLLAAPDPANQGAARAERPSGPGQRFVQLLAAHCSLLAEMFLCAVVMTLLGISTSYFVQHLIDSVLVRGESNMLNALGLGMAVVMTFRVLLSVLRQYLLAYIGRRIDLSLMSNYMRHILRLPQQFLEMRQVGETMSRFHDAAKVREAIGGAALTVFVDGVLVLFATGLLWIYDAQLALIASLFSPLLIAAVLLHLPATRNRSRNAMEAAAALSAHMVENISGASTIKAFCAEDRRSHEADNLLVRTAKSMFSMQILNLSMTTAGGIVNSAAGITILWIGGHRVIDGALTIGELMFFYSLLGYMLEPMERLAGVNLQIQDALVAVDRLYQVMDVDGETTKLKNAQLTTVGKGIEFRDVSFRYGCRENVLSHINLRIPAGATIAIVGESGCGKSTLLRLLTRFCDPTAGCILIDGIDMRDYELESLRRRIGLVAQEPFIFTGTIRENIALGRPDASLNEIIAAARSAGLDEFIASMPQRYDSLIGERGGNLSGGQRQRLAIARALLCAPEILLFDEATSHLDTTTEQAIQENLKTAFANRTVVLVAHRLSTIREADFVCVIDRGHIIELGTHLELIQLKGRYAALWRTQLSENRTQDCSRIEKFRLDGNANGSAVKKELN